MNTPRAFPLPSLIFSYSFTLPLNFSYPLNPPSSPPSIPSPQALQQNNTDGAKIYASNAIRKKNEALNYLRLGSRIDAVASRVETAVTMRGVTSSMGSVVKGMDKAMQSMNLEMVSFGVRGG